MTKTKAQTVNERHFARIQQQLKEYWQDLMLMVENQEIDDQQANEWYNSTVDRLMASHTPSDEIQEKAIKEEYPTLKGYLDEKLPQMVKEVSDRLIGSHPVLSTTRALSLAAAIIAVSLGDEHENLEQATRSASIDGNLTDEQANLYDAMVEKQETEGYREQLIRLTGTRTLPADEHKFRNWDKFSTEVFR